MVYSMIPRACGWYGASVECLLFSFGVHSMFDEKSAPFLIKYYTGLHYSSKPKLPCLCVRLFNVGLCVLYPAYFQDTVDHIRSSRALCFPLPYRSGIHSYKLRTSCPTHTGSRALLAARVKVAGTPIRMVVRRVLHGCMAASLR